MNLNLPVGRIFNVDLNHDHWCSHLIHYLRNYHRIDVIEGKQSEFEEMNQISSIRGKQNYINYSNNNDNQIYHSYSSYIQNFKF